MAVLEQFSRPARSRTGELAYDEKRRTQCIWEKRTRHGRRWLVEIIFSAFKHMFGELLHLLKWKSMVQAIKVATHNKLMEMDVRLAYGQMHAPLDRTE